jgi:hypothetical protein
VTFAAADLTITGWEPLDKTKRDDEHQATVRARAGLPTDLDSLELVTTSPLLEQPEEGTPDYNAVLEQLAEVANRLAGA